MKLNRQEIDMTLRLRLRCVVRTNARDENRKGVTMSICQDRVTGNVTA